MRLLFAGTPKTAVPVVERLSEVHECAAVLARPPAPQGRRSALVPSPVEQWARDNGVRVLAPKNLRDPGFTQAVREIAPECCPVVAFGGLITDELMDIPRLGWINLHYSLLPAYRGAAPVQRALLDGCTTTGVSVFRIVKALDAGPIFCQHQVKIAPHETAGDLLNSLSIVGADALLDGLQMAADGVEPQEQSHELASLAPKLTTLDERLDLREPSRQIVNRVRAMSPDPGAWAELSFTGIEVPSQRLKILRASVISPEMEDSLRGMAQQQGDHVGKVLVHTKAVYVRSVDGWIELIEVQPAGKKPMSAVAWSNGVRTLPWGTLS